MPKIKKQNKAATLDTLALMVKKGFDHVDKRFDRIDKQFAENKEDHQEIFLKLRN